jgi:hypothetical protein
MALFYFFDPELVDQAVFSFSLALSFVVKPGLAGEQACLGSSSSSAAQEM